MPDVADLVVTVRDDGDGFSFVGEYDDEALRRKRLGPLSLKHLAFDFSTVGGTLVVAGCDSRVGNQTMSDGFIFQDLVSAAVAASAGNHGDLVTAVSNLANEWKKASLISGRDQGAVTSCVATSKNQGKDKGGA